MLVAAGKQKIVMMITAFILAVGSIMLQNKSFQSFRYKSMDSEDSNNQRILLISDPKTVEQKSHEVQNPATSTVALSPSSSTSKMKSSSKSPTKLHFYSMLRLRGDRSGATIHDMIFCHAYSYYNNATYGGAVGNSTHIIDHQKLLKKLGLDLSIMAAVPLNDSNHIVLDPKIYRKSDSNLFTTDYLQYLRLQTNYTESDIDIAVHIRRGDVTPCNEKVAFRYLPNSYYLDLIKQHAKPNSRVVIYSDNESFESFNIFQKMGYELALGGELGDVWEGILNANVVIMSKSSFSFVPAMLCKGKVLYPPFWHAPLPGWDIVDILAYEQEKVVMQEASCQGKVRSPQIPSYEEGDYVCNDMTFFLTGPAAPMNKNNSLFFPMHNSTEAICEFRKTHMTNHFVHSMEQLYSCFSWWQANSHQTPVLLIDNNGWGKNGDLRFPNSYVEGFVTTLVDAYGLYMIEPTDETRGRSVTPTKGGLPHCMRSPQDAVKLRDVVYGFFRHNQTDQLSNNGKIPTMAGCPSPHNSSSKLPVIGFLNRVGGRHVENENEILKALQDANTASDIRYLDSFDGMSFQEQVIFMAEVDVLIGPHGAQFASIAFLPPCGGLVEFFPTGYFVPSYFGSLAASTGHGHVYIYTGNSTTREVDITTHSKTYESRSAARAQKIHANEYNVVQAVKELTRRWKKCCHESTEASSN